MPVGKVGKYKTKGGATFKVFTTVTGDEYEVLKHLAWERKQSVSTVVRDALKRELQNATTGAP